MLVRLIKGQRLVDYLVYRVVTVVSRNFSFNTCFVCHGHGIEERSGFDLS
jgi:hypothetical protein